VSALFVSGTDTGCGKTQVACALARALRAAGRRVRVLKPVETGCELRAGALVPADALALAAAAGDDAPLERLCPFRLELAAAPEVAARAAGIEIDPARIANALAAAHAAADVVLVEGAGGLLVPLRADLDVAGLVARLDLPLLLVARASLGTMNHTLLTLEAAAARGLRIAGVVVSHGSADLPEGDRRNLAALRAQLERRQVPWLGELAHAAERLAPEPLPRALLTILGNG